MTFLVVENIAGIHSVIYFPLHFSGSPLGRECREWPDGEANAAVEAIIEHSGNQEAVYVFKDGSVQLMNVPLFNEYHGGINFPPFSLQLKSSRFNCSNWDSYNEPHNKKWSLRQTQRHPYRNVHFCEGKTL